MIYYTAKRKSLPSSPNEYYREHMQQLINSQWDNTTMLQTIEEEKPFTKMLAKDGEGASKLIECTCDGAKDIDTAIIVAKSVIRSPLFKCAMFGEDANWGRVLCAIGYADCDFDITKVDVDLKSDKGIVSVCKNIIYTISNTLHHWYIITTLIKFVGLITINTYKAF